MYSPQWKGAVEGFAVNYSRRNMWKVRDVLEFEDVMQEARLLFELLRRRHVWIDTPEHFMALYKTSWTRMFIDLAAQATRARRVCYQYQFPERELGEVRSDLAEMLPGDLDTSGAVSMLVREAPREVKQVLALMLHAPSEFVELVGKAFSTGYGVKKASALVCKALNIPTKNILEEVREYFAE